MCIQFVFFFIFRDFRKLGVQEDELRMAVERAELAETKLKKVEEELQMVSQSLQRLMKN